MMKKQIQLFLLHADEEEVSKAIKAIRSNVVFVDDNVWNNPQPVTTNSIGACSSNFVYLWDPGVCYPYPTISRKDGRFEGPTSGVVIQFSRTRKEEQYLLSGSLAAGIGTGNSQVDKNMETFVSDVWKVFTKTIHGAVSAVHPISGEIIREKVTEYKAGRHAIKWAQEEKHRFFKDRSTENYFRPRLSVESGKGVRHALNSRGL